ncbi:hypothetical protein [Methylocystis hirsuta]|nr:hypothetical protein [Methylocystis hirsuta]
MLSRISVVAALGAALILPSTAMAQYGGWGWGGQYVNGGDKLCQMAA